MPEDPQKVGRSSMDGHATSKNGAREGQRSSLAQTYIQKGNATAASGDFEAAEEAFEQAVAADPSDARARYDLALARQNLSDPEGAIASYMRAIRLDPSLLEAYINLGNLYGEIGLFEEALEVFQRALELDSANDELFINVGDAYRTLGFFDDAILAYRQAQILNPDNAVAADKLRDVRERMTVQAENIAELERRVDDDPRDISRYADLADAYLEAHREQDAMNLVHQMVALEPENPMSFEMQALASEAMGGVEEAAEAWQHVVELSPNDAEAWEHLGTWREEEGRLDDAIAAFKRAAELSPETPTLRFSVAELLRDADQYDEALETYHSLITEFDNPQDEQQEKTLAEAHTGLAATLKVAGRYDEALASTKEFLRRFPGNSEALYEQASAYEALGQHDEAIAAYEQALEGDPLNPDICNDLADTYLAVGRVTEAIELAETAVSLDPELAVGYETLAQALLAAGRGDEAEEAFQRAAELREDEDDEGDDEN